MVQQSSLGPQEAAHGAEVLGRLGRTDVFEHAHGRDGVERPVSHVTVVLHTDLDLLGQPLCHDPVPGKVRLRGTQGDADHLLLRSSVAACSAKDPHPQPDVENPCTRRLAEPQLAADEVVLGLLGRFEGVDARGETGT